MQNAVDAIREAGKRREEIRVRTSQRADGMAEVAVDDTGTGLSAAAAERLYEPFFTTKPQGMGMGLAISRTIVEMHHGRLAVGARGRPATAPPCASALPLDGERRHDGADGLRGRRQPGRPQIAAGARRGGGPGGRDLSRPPASSSRPTTRGGPAASSWTSACAGRAVSTSRTSSAGGNATLPIIVMTGYADVPTSVRAFKGGAIDFLRKPVPPKQLHRAHPRGHRDRSTRPRGGRAARRP